MSVDTIEKTAIEQIQKLKGFLPEKNKEELYQILAYGEKMKAEGEKKEKKFWSKYDRDYFKNLLWQYEETKEKFIKSLALDERKMLNNLVGLSKEKFYNEYLYKRIVYSGEIDDSYRGSLSIKYENEDGNFDLEKFKDWVKSSKNSLSLFIEINLFRKDLGYEGVKILAETWKDSLKPGMKINLGDNDLGKEGVKILAELWKNSLQPGMEIELDRNNLGYEGVKILAESWKNSLQPGMRINLGCNELGYEGVKILAETWKDSLQPGMKINLLGNNLGDEGLKILAEIWKDNLQPGMGINLGYNKIGDEGLKILAEIWKDNLQPGMSIALRGNNLGDEGIRSIMQNLKLKQRVILDLRDNGNISDKMKKEIERWLWVQGYKNQGMNCYVFI